MENQVEWLREHVCGTLGLEPALFDKAAEREAGKSLLAQFFGAGAPPTLSSGVPSASLGNSCICCTPEQISIQRQ